MRKTLLLCDTPNQYIDTYDLIVYWASFERNHKSLSIPKIVEENDDLLKKEYLTWLHHLSYLKIDGSSIVDILKIRKGFSFWWTSLLVEKSQWKSPGLYDAFRLMALDKVLHMHDISEIDVAVTNRSVQKTILEWSSENRVVCRVLPMRKVYNSLSVRRLYNTLPNGLLALITFFRYLIDHWPLRKIKKVGKSDFYANNITFISYFFNLDKDSAENGEFITHYWTSLHKVLSEGNYNVRWLNLFLKSDFVPTSKKGALLVDRYNSDQTCNQSHMLLEGMLGWKVIKGVITDYFRSYSNGLQIKNVRQYFSPAGVSLNLWYVLRTDWNCSLFGKTAVLNCLFLNLFEHTLNLLPRQKKGFYLLENQAWERCLIYAWKTAGHGEIIGVPHTVVSPWDLRHFNASAAYSTNHPFKLPIPDKVALNGEMAIAAYSDGEFPKENTVHVEALRYLYLNQSSVYSKIKPKGLTVKLLVLGDYLTVVTNKQLRMLELAVDALPPNLEILVKAHPACPINTSEWPALKMKIVNKSLDQLVSQYDIAYTSNATAAAVDAYLAGKRVLTMLDPESFNMSPLRGFHGVEFVATSIDLVKQLCKKQDEHRRYSEYFFTDSHLPRWRKLLERI